MQKLRTFLNENSDVIWPALCLVFCGLTILFAAMRSIHISGYTGMVTIVKDNREGAVSISGAGTE